MAFVNPIPKEKAAPNLAPIYCRRTFGRMPNFFAAAPDGAHVFDATARRLGRAGPFSATDVRRQSESKAV